MVIMYAIRFARRMRGTQKWTQVLIPLHTPASRPRSVNAQIASPSQSKADYKL